MKKFNKIMSVLLILVAVVAFVAPVFAEKTASPIDTTLPDNMSKESITTVDTAVGTAWNTIKLILQICAIGAVVFAGVRYMFASADQKADIKKSMGILAIGAALVFGATFIIDFIRDVATQITRK